MDIQATFISTYITNCELRYMLMTLTQFATRRTELKYQEVVVLYGRFKMKCSEKSCSEISPYVGHSLVYWPLSTFYGPCEASGSVDGTKKQQRPELGPELLIATLLSGPPCLKLET